MFLAQHGPLIMLSWSMYIILIGEPLFFLHFYQERNRSVFTYNWLSESKNSPYTCRAKFGVCFLAPSNDSMNLIWSVSTYMYLEFGLECEPPNTEGKCTNHCQNETTYKSVNCLTVYCVPVRQAHYLHTKTRNVGHIFVTVIVHNILQAMLPEGFPFHQFKIYVNYILHFLIMSRVVLT